MGKINTKQQGNTDVTMAKATTHKLPVDSSELGEGPSYDRKNDTAWWLDIYGKSLVEYKFATTTARVHALPRMASVVARIDDERQLIAMEDGIYLRLKADGSLTLLAPLEADNTVTRSNDGRVHPSGRIWIGTMGRKAEREAGAIYWFDGLTVKTLFRNITVTNSICFSPDGATGYFADSSVNKVWRVALDPKTGLPSGEPEVFLEGDDLPLRGNFDGSVIDADGILWNAAWRGGSVSGFAPDGTLVRTFEIPAAQTTCPCFIGKDLDRMLVTTAWCDLSDEARAADPGAGFTYVIDGGFAGMADSSFLLEPAS
jgi:sugar lactone lactonase YvrE